MLDGCASCRTACAHCACASAYQDVCFCVVPDCVAAGHSARREFVQLVRSLHVVIYASECTFLCVFAFPFIWYVFHCPEITLETKPPALWHWLPVGCCGGCHSHTNVLFGAQQCLLRKTTSTMQLLHCSILSKSSAIQLCRLWNYGYCFRAQCSPRVYMNCVHIFDAQPNPIHIY